MKVVKIVIFLFSLFTLGCKGQEKKTTSNDSGIRAGFWNLENLFDTIQNQSNDKDFTPGGMYHWNTERYNNKIANLSKVINAIQPDLLGVCEVENINVLQDLVSKDFAGKSYGIVHYNSPDERGIDVALLYDKSKISIINSDTFHIPLPDKNDRTRNILQVVCMSISTQDTFVYYVNHWPSRREGEEVSEANRLAAAKLLKKMVDIQLLKKRNIIITGDLNDNPWDSSVKNVLDAKRAFNKKQELHNLSALLNLEEYGTLKHAGKWHLFDQLIVSEQLIKGKNGLKYKSQSSTTFKPEWLQQHGDKYEGYPLRTFGGKNYLNGYSDHFPVFFDLTYVR